MPTGARIEQKWTIRTTCVPLCKKMVCRDEGATVDDPLTRICSNNQSLFLMPSSLLSHVPAKELWPVWSLPPRPKCFNQARILNEWRPRVCRREEEKGRQFLEMITDSFPCLSCAFERERPPLHPPHWPFTLHHRPMSFSKTSLCHYSILV